MPKLGSRICSFVLSAAMLLNMLPVNAFAEEADISENTDTIAIEETGTAPVTVIGEVEDLREEDTKHFRLSNGNNIAVAYGMPVHYEDADGRWQDIDNRFSVDGNAQTLRVSTDNTATVFSSSLNSGSLFTVSKGNHSVSMSLLDTAAAELMISGGNEDNTPEETLATEPETVETIPETTETLPEVVETVPESDETTPGIVETIPESTETVPETIETIPETTDVVPDIAETVPTENSEDIVESESIADETQYAADALLLSETNFEEDPSVEEPTDSAASLTENEASATEAASEPTAAPTVSELVPETTPETAATEAETTPETFTTEVTEETIPETLETVPETSAETEPLEEISGDQLIFNREATAVVVEDTPSMLTIQESYDWDVTDVIPKHLQTSLRYSDVFPNTDFLYTAFGYNIKEQIIVKQPQSSYRYDFLVETNGLQAVLNEDGSISFNDADGNGVYSIPVPYMQDGADALSPNVTYTITPIAQGVVLTVTADADWINAEDRVFPVMIDPTITIESGKALDEIYSVYTMEAAPNDTTLGRQYLYVGAQPFSTTNDGRYRLYMHFHNMPQIPAGSEVVDATLSLYQHQYTQRNCPSFPIGVYEVTTNLPSSYSSYYDWFTKMTWRRDQPDYDIANAIDYVMVDATKTYRTWDMTELVKKWYAEGTSNTTAALVMMNENEIDTYGYFASAAFYAYASSIPPVLIVAYRNNTGIEPYYTYATLGGASAGTAYIADATGQLKVGKELASYASSANPFSLNLVYNSDYFSMASSADYQPPIKLGLNMNVGTGWTLDCIQKVEPETIDNVEYLKYTDGDGTIHYFVKDPSPKDSNYPYYDEDGLCLKMKVDGSNNYTMADDDGNEWIFSGNYLTSIKDSDGNQINIAYSNSQITKITQVNKDQPAIEVANFAYSGNTLSSVTDNAGNVYALDYTNGNLTSIRKNSTTIATYTYDGYRLNQMTDSESAYSLSFTYADGKVASYKELGGATPGATVSVSYPSHSQTVYRDSGNDRVFGNADDILTHYLFDYASRTANAYTTDNNGTILGATNSAYYEKSRTSKTNDKRNNRTVRTASIGLASQQLIKNPSIENDNNEWSFEGTSRTSAKARTGSYSIGGTLTNNANQFALRSSEELTAGKTYTLSAYVNTSDITRFDGNGICLMITDGSKNWTSNYVNYITSNTVDNGWVRISVTFTAPITDVYGITIFNSGSIGTFYADDLQLEEAAAPSSYNLLENGNFEMSNHGWTMGTGASVTASTGVAGSAASLKITGNPTEQSTNAYQDVNLNQNASQTYVLSGWVNANAVPDDDENKESDLSNRSKECGLRATITYSDGNTEEHYAPFNSDLSKTWQFVSLTIVPKEKAKTVSKIRVTCAYEGNANEAFFDNISLVRETAQTMRYDEDGKLVSVLSPALKENVNTYENGNLIKTVTGGYGTYQYTYDNTYKHRLNSVTNEQITQSMTYDNAGNAVTTKLSGKGSKTISTSATYEGSQNRLSSITNATGAKTTYGYGTNNAKMMALPTSVTDALGTTTTTAYDSNYRVTKTGIENLASLVYTYADGNLDSAQRTNNTGITQAYNFTYDAFGNMTSLKVGNQTLATYDYNAGNGLLQKQAYGNGDWVSFEYDKLGRITKSTYSDGLVATYVYNGEGNLHKLTETKGENTDTYLYTYDSAGRLINSEKVEADRFAIGTHQIYNEFNQLVKKSWQMAGATYADDYTYNSSDGSLNTFTISRNGSTLYEYTMAYDELRRLQSMKNDVLSREYTYRDISNTQSTTQIASVIYKKAAYGNVFDYAKYLYTYDSAGNILTYADTINNTISYTYDKQGQLLTEKGTVNNYGNGEITFDNTFTYDSAGNILTSSDGSETHTYTYGDADWKDLLTAYDGEEFTYDAAGNPTSYYNGERWTFSWKNGRQLESMSRKPPVVFTTQPENYIGSAGETAVFTVIAEGDRLTYQWQCSTDEGSTWANVTAGGTDATLNVQIQSSSVGNLYRCIAKDYMGHVATSQAGKILPAKGQASVLSFENPEITILNEPDDYYGRVGDTATFIVEAEGTGLTYQWLYQAPSAEEFEYCTGNDATSSTMRVEMTPENNGGEYRCFITAANGDMVSTRVATIKLDVRDWRMEYDASGLRTKRISGDRTYNYLYAGDKLMRMTVGNDTLDFSYDPDGRPLTVTYNGHTYYYITNLQGDVISLEDRDGVQGARYLYDAWGNVIYTGSGKLAELNPLRYRGYVYDQETGFYYLQSRYYDPSIGRFINADVYASSGQSIIGHNMYAYCNNNPMAFADDEGQFAIMATLGAMAVGAAVSFTTQYLGDVMCNALEGKSGIDIFKPNSSLGEYVTSTLTGALCSIPGVNAVVPIACDIAGPAVKQVIDSVHENRKLDFDVSDYLLDVGANRVASHISKVTSFETPKFIRDIKNDAHALGIKGTKQLKTYLNAAKRTAFMNNQFVSFAQGISFKFATKVFSIALN